MFYNDVKIIIKFCLGEMLGYSKELREKVESKSLS